LVSVSRCPPANVRRYLRNYRGAIVANKIEGWRYQGNFDRTNSRDRSTPLAIIDAEVVWLDADGVAQFDALHSRIIDRAAVACAFELLMLEGYDLRCKPLVERKDALRAFEVRGQPAVSGLRAPAM
jgi:hypothetical protein